MSDAEKKGVSFVMVVLSVVALVLGSALVAAVYDGDFPEVDPYADPRARTEIPEYLYGVDYYVVPASIAA